MGVVRRNCLAGGVCGSLVGSATAVLLKTLTSRLLWAICSTAEAFLSNEHLAPLKDFLRQAWTTVPVSVREAFTQEAWFGLPANVFVMGITGACSGFVLGAILSPRNQQRTKQLSNSSSRVVPLTEAQPCEDGTKTEKVVPPSSDANGNLEGRDVKSLGSASGLNAVTVSSGAGVLHESTVSKEDQDCLVQRLEGIAELQQQIATDEQPENLQMDASTNSPPRSFKVPGEPHQEAGLHQEAGSFTVRSEQSWTSISSSVVTSPTRGSRLLAEKCRFCGKRPGTILGLKGFGLWQRSHEKRCAARHGVILHAPDSFISETAAGA
eukprot:TRINITY_DN3691_c0_g2_i2.p1 TRINITY_DN3691_c0_g2~~TRINITY_DN3691_c0_g2_i2.p1  ORF type:complete len:343 (-),score=64.63 TRINITY_DN3691_c0_g2_i2:81-1049(-)